MQSYRPPHMRQSPAVAITPSTSSSPASAREPQPPVQNQPITYTQQASSQPRPTRNPYPNSHTPRPSHRDWSSKSSTPYSLASPASDLKPMKFRKSPMKEKDGIDEMELLQSVSRSGGDGAEGDALKDWGMQERYRRYIDERIERHHAAYNRARHTPPPITSTDEVQSLGSIVLLFRKLREGVVASHRIDSFAVEVFESSARMAILARNPAQLLSSLSGLVPGLYLAVKGNGKGKATSSPVDDLTERLVSLDVSNVTVDDHRAEFASILLLYHLAHSKSRQTFHSTLMDLVSPHTPSLSSRYSTSTSKPLNLPTIVSQSDLSFAIQADQALAVETFDPFIYFQLLQDTARASPYERAVLAWAEEGVRERAWLVMKKAYFESGIPWTSRWLGLEDERCVEWSKMQAARIEGDRVRLR